MSQLSLDQCHEVEVNCTRQHQGKQTPRLPLHTITPHIFPPATPCFGFFRHDSDSRLNFSPANSYPRNNAKQISPWPHDAPPIGARRRVSWPERERKRGDEGEISPIRGQAEVITTTPKLKQMENGVQHDSTSTVGFISPGHVFCCSTGLEECQTFEFWIMLL